MKKRRVLLWIAVICLLAMLLPSTVLAASQGWNKNQNGTWSYYTSWGTWYKDCVVQIDGQYYGFDANGIMYENRWFETEYSEWYYFGKGGAAYRDGAYKVGNSYYGFDSNGVWIRNETFELYDEETGTWYEYRNKEDDTLYVNQWYQDDWGNYYYYDANGRMCKNVVCNIGGKYYGFNWSGRLYSNEIFSVWDQTTEKTAYYYAKADGTLYTGGWQLINGHYHYFAADGKMYQRGIYNIEGKYYGFDYDGWMYDDMSFSIWNDDLGRSVYYRAKAGGALYVNEWYVDNWDNWYYYGAGGVAGKDFTQIKGVWYFFDYSGRMVKNEVVYSEKYQANYYINKDGTGSTKAPTTGWVKFGEDFYYFSNNEMYQGGVYNISGKYYGFDWSGCMYDNRSFSTNAYDESLETWVSKYYRAKEGGALYVNEWYQNGNNWYYYGAGGVAPKDFAQIKGAWYFFDYNGRMLTNRLVYSSQYQAYYVLDAQGKSTKVSADGWVTVGDDYYYAKNNTLYKAGVYQIGSNYYGFDDEGRMYNNTTFYAYSQKDERYTQHRAQKGGALYVNQWYQDGNEWYYYGEAGAGPDDFTKVGSTWYYFESGRMVTDRLVYSYNYQAYYVISEDGKSCRVITKDGWVSAGDRYYYILNGTLCTDGVYQIDGKYYGFDWEGEMYRSTTFSYGAYDDATSEWIYKYYRAKENGDLYVNEWYKDGGEWYYYGAAGVGVTGWKQVDNAWYYFNYARMMKNTHVYSKGAYYALDKDGKQIKTAGKHAVGGAYVYVQADGTLKTGWVQISGKWHYFDPYMIANTIYIIDGKLYAVDNAGVCVAVTGSGTYDIGASGKVYLESGKVTAGWKKVGENWYYFDNYMYKDGVYEIEGERYVFDLNGKLFTGGWILVDENSYYGGYAYYAYADASGKAAIGLKTIGGKQYYFNEYGLMNTEATVEVDGVTYIIDASGVATAVGSGTGWKKVGNAYYYVQNGKLVREESIRIGGKLYGFGYGGRMLTNTVYWFDNGNSAAFGADGVANVGWQKVGTAWYYNDENCNILTGKQTIGGKTYIFSEALRIGTFWYDGKIITTNGDGEVVSEKDPTNGWSYVNGSVYYYKNGEPVNGWEGSYLLIDGRMAINDWVSWKGDYYAFDVYGKYVKSGWHQFYYGDGDYSNYVYAKDGGVLCCNEWYQINGVWYYFSGPFILTDGIYYVEGEYCRFDASGKYLGKVTAFNKDGWQQIGSDWYYVHGGEPVIGVNWINRKRYVFDYNGVMMSGGFNSFEGRYFYTDDNGAIPNYTGWQKINGVWCYFDSSNLPVIGWFQDKGKTYYSEAQYGEDALTVGIVTGYMYQNGKLHYFNSDGVYQGTKGVENGWFQADGEWYYFRNGKAVNGYQEIDGKNYYFISGVMKKKVLTYRGYFGEDGVLCKTVGWYQFGNRWVYVQLDGTLCDGVYQIDGKEYYFCNYFMVER